MPKAVDVFFYIQDGKLSRSIVISTDTETMPKNRPHNYPHSRSIIKISLETKTYVWLTCACLGVLRILQ
jgi:hypothetical protein